MKTKHINTSTRKLKNTTPQLSKHSAYAVPPKQSLDHHYMHATSTSTPTRVAKRKKRKTIAKCVSHHEQQALDLPWRPEAAEERDDGGDDAADEQHVDRAGQHVVARQLAHVVDLVDQGHNREDRDADATDLEWFVWYLAGFLFI